MACNKKRETESPLWSDYTLQESILPNFEFFVFPILAFKVGHFKAQTIFSYTLKLNNEKWKKSLFYKEKCLVGLTPALCQHIQEFKKIAEKSERETYSQIWFTALIC